MRSGLASSFLRSRPRRHAASAPGLDSVGPQTRDDHPVGQHLVGVRDEEFHQIPLGRRQVDVSPPGRQPPSLHVELQIAEADNRIGAGVGRAACRSATPDPRQQLVDTERLGQIIVSTEVERDNLVTLGFVCREDHDRRAGAFPDGSGRQAIDIGQAQVEQDHGPARRRSYTSSASRPVVAVSTRSRGDRDWSVPRAGCPARRRRPAPARQSDAS